MTFALRLIGVWCVVSVPAAVLLGQMIRGPR